MIQLIKIAPDVKQCFYWLLFLLLKAVLKGHLEEVLVGSVRTAQFIALLVDDLYIANDEREGCQGSFEFLHQC